MDSITESLSAALFFVTLLFVPIIVLTIIYLIKRNGFYTSVNCWFCNGWTKVLYADRNSFSCPSCQQYNGFGEDGGYNKVIEAQYNTSFNNYNKTVEKIQSLSNGLCIYCNNNQQLKVKQLANFVPLNERNYDVEVEHFREQLEKSYKLCKKCDKVLKKTIENQHAWIFGNRIKSLHKKGLRLLTSRKSKIINKVFKESFTTSLIRSFLILFSLIVLCQIIKVRISDRESIFKKYTPDVFVPYTILFNDWCHIISNVMENVIKNVNNKLNLHLPSQLKDVGITQNTMLPMIWIGLILEIILSVLQLRSALWRANGLLSWIILIATSSSTFSKDFFVYINTLQMLCSVTIIYSLLVPNKPGSKNGHKKKNYTFKKFKPNMQRTESSDEELSDETFNSSFFSTNSRTGRICKDNIFSASICQSPSQTFLFQDRLQKTAKLSNTFTTARSTKCSSVFNSSIKNKSNNSSGNDLHVNLDNLHLSNSSFKQQPCTSPVFSVKSVNRSILSPPKLKNITQNPWTAGGFWKDEVAACSTSTDVANRSRSSSQSSGFVSTNDPIISTDHNPLPFSREPSLFDDFEKASIFSEPAYHFKPINSSYDIGSSSNNFSIGMSQLPKQFSPRSSHLYYKTDNNMFHPILKHNNMLLIQGNNVPTANFENSFGNLSLQNLSTSSNRFNSPAFGAKPVISSLFKNLQGATTQSHTFTAPNC